MTPLKNQKQRFEWNGEWREILPSDAEIIELTPNHYLVVAQHSRFEVFLLPDGTFSDGSALHGISLRVETERDRIIRDRFQGAAVSGTNQAGSVVIKSPMPGLVRAVKVQTGDAVERTTTVLVLEAMKMENNILAGANGHVKKILVQEGSSVEKNAGLVEIEV